ncbi:hypothetical protein HYY69_00315 [Candidatus Woesearchaeota archaeon]|nr:hypothetical protein [Candidatus Woesearchaeota archaeon]
MLNHFGWKKTLLITILIAAILVIASCSKVECRKDTQCVQKACQTAVCSNNVCKYTPVPNCCGNLQCEAGETRCSCEVDCKPACKGDVILEQMQSKNKTSEYLQYACNEKTQNCEVQVKKEKVKPITLINSWQQPNLRLDMELKYKQPFDVAKDEVQVKISLQDADAKVKLPLVISKVQIISGQELLGSKNLNEKLNSIGASTMVSIPIIAQLNTWEEKRAIKVKVDYDALVFKTEEIIEQSRNNVEKQFSGQIIFVKTGEDESESSSK